MFLTESSLCETVQLAFVRQDSLQAAPLVPQHGHHVIPAAKKI